MSRTNGTKAVIFDELDIEQAALKKEVNDIIDENEYVLTQAMINTKTDVNKALTAQTETVNSIIKDNEGVILLTITNEYNRINDLIQESETRLLNELREFL